jgi:hypothetical protein
MELNLSGLLNNAIHVLGLGLGNLDGGAMKLNAVDSVLSHPQETKLNTHCRHRYTDFHMVEGYCGAKTSACKGRLNNFANSFRKKNEIGTNSLPQSEMQNVTGERLLYIFITRKVSKIVGILTNFMPGSLCRIQITSFTDFANFITVGPVWLRFPLRMGQKLPGGRWEEHHRHRREITFPEVGWHMMYVDFANSAACPPSSYRNVILFIEVDRNCTRYPYSRRGGLS